MNVINSAESEQIKYEKMWAIDEYRIHSPEVTHLSCLVAVMGERGSVNIYGCGPGRAGAKLAAMGHAVHMLDIARNCLDLNVRNAMLSVDNPLYFHDGPLWEAHNILPPADWGYCCDVLEHLPTDQVRASLRAIATLTPRAYMTVSHVADGFGKRINDTLHLTVKPIDWWLKQITSAWRDQGHNPNDIRVTEQGSTSSVVISQVGQVVEATIR